METADNLGYYSCYFLKLVTKKWSKTIETKVTK